MESAGVGPPFHHVLWRSPVECKVFTMISLEDAHFVTIPCPPLSLEKNCHKVYLSSQSQSSSLDYYLLGIYFSILFTFSAFVS